MCGRGNISGAFGEIARGNHSRVFVFLAIAVLALTVGAQAQYSYLDPMLTPSQGDLYLDEPALVTFNTALRELTIGLTKVADGVYQDGVVTFRFDSVYIAEEVPIAVTGPHPVSILSQNDMRIDATFDVSGIEGSYGYGVGRAGAGVGGDP